MNICKLCGKQVEGAQLCYSVDLEEVFCNNCIYLLGGCYSCGNVVSCAFEQDPSPLPKIVVQTVQQGNMTMQTQIRNPEREAITCKTKCPCWNEEWGCGRTKQFAQFCINNKWEWINK